MCACATRFASASQRGLTGLYVGLPNLGDTATNLILEQLSLDATVVAGYSTTQTVVTSHALLSSLVAADLLYVPTASCVLAPSGGGH